MRRELVHLITSIIIALAVLGAYAFWFSLLSSARAEAQSTRVSVKAIEAEDAAIAKAQGALTALVADEAAVAAYEVVPEEVVDFLEELEGTGETLRTDVEVVSVSAIADGRIEVALKIQGTFSAVMRSLGSLEYGPRDLRTKQLTLDTAAGEAGGAWTAALSMSAAVRTTP